MDHTNMHPEEGSGSETRVWLDSGADADVDGVRAEGMRETWADRVDVGMVVGGRYRLIELIGQGGMGWVYAAEHLSLGGSFAVKVLAPMLAGNPEFVRRFRREGRAAMAVEHPSVVRVFDLELGPPVPYLAMELIRGRTIRAWLDGLLGGHPPIADVCDVLAQVASALAAAHDAGLVHRDLKPDNVLLSGGSGHLHATVVDFGLVHLDDREVGPTLTQADHVAGTPAYMSPEQCRSLEVGPAADLYALGCILHEALTDAPPFAASNAIELIARQMYVPAPALMRRPGAPPVPRALDELRLALLAKLPEDRPADAHVVERALRSILDEPEPAHCSGAPQRGSKAPRGQAFPSRGGQATAPSAAIALVHAPGDGSGEISSLAVGLGLLGFHVTAILEGVREPPPPGTQVAVFETGGALDRVLQMVAEWRAQAPKVPLVVCVRGLTAEQVGRLVEAGAADAIRSPIQLPRLVQRLARVLRHGTTQGVP